ncbi:hypothetical protein AURDEDRAFT_159195 [Auricularia subglabra TFB-10046 SS5]|nr:hypothetical protein AURDEDRAFT_159195 [Auricularia subglabra TFB-10046 SS5]
MPDAAPAESAAAAAVNHRGAEPGDKPDRVGEELADDARIWRVYDRVAKEDDDRRITTWNRGLDNLALFAGLFSAVTTAFIIESRGDLQPDYLQLTFQVLNATAFGQPFVPEPFVVPSGARAVNCLWIASLVLSLSAALIAIMGKDWIGTYASHPVCNARQWAEMRTYRLSCVERWYMPGVIASAPVLLHLSLLYFGAGLVLFVSPDPVTRHVTLGLCVAAGFLYFVTTSSAVVFPSSPFKSPATQAMRAAISALISLFRRPEKNALLSLQAATHGIVAPGLSVTNPYTPLRRPGDHRPELIAQSLSWLSRASQAPDISRAVMFALGDLEIGDQVGHLVPLELQTRIRAEIRQNWQQADFLTLSRYVLADRNFPGDPVLSYTQFQQHSDVESAPSLRCEDGLAAIVKLSPFNVIPEDIALYTPQHVSQPRMRDFLHPFTARATYEAMVVLANRYSTHLTPSDVFRLEVQLRLRLRPWMLKDYLAKVSNEYDYDCLRVRFLHAQLCHPYSLLD